MEWGFIGLGMLEGIGAALGVGMGLISGVCMGFEGNVIGAHTNSSPFFKGRMKIVSLKKIAFFCHFEGTVFHTLPQISLFIKFAHFLALLRGVKEQLFLQNQKAYGSLSPQKTFCWLI